MDMGKTFTTFMSFVLAAGGITFFLLDEYQKLAIFLIACAVLFPLLREEV